MWGGSIGFGQFNLWLSPWELKIICNSVYGFTRQKCIDSCGGISHIKSYKLNSMSPDVIYLEIIQRYTCIDNLD